MKIMFDKEKPKSIGLGDVVKYNNVMCCLVIKLNGQIDDYDECPIRLVNLENSLTVDSFKSLEELNKFTLVELIAKSNEIKIGWNK